jgi:hypothetical protein
LLTDFVVGVRNGSSHRTEIQMVVGQAVDTSQQYIVLHQTKKGASLYTHVLQNVRARGPAIVGISGHVGLLEISMHVSVLLPFIFFTLLTKNCYLADVQMDGHFGLIRIYCKKSVEIYLPSEL